MCSDLTLLRYRPNTLTRAHLPMGPSLAGPPATWSHPGIRMDSRGPCHLCATWKKDNFCFLTVWGREAKLPFGSPRKQPSFFQPIWKELNQKIRKLEKTFSLYRVLRVSKKMRKWFSFSSSKSFSFSSGPRGSATWPWVPRRIRAGLARHVSPAVLRN